jgi:hypothetical protein
MFVVPVLDYKKKLKIEKFQIGRSTKTFDTRCILYTSTVYWRAAVFDGASKVIRCSRNPSHQHSLAPIRTYHSSHLV